MPICLPSFAGVAQPASGTPAIFNVTTRDTEANILASTPTNPSGEVNIAFGTDTKDFYIYSGSSWYNYNNDS